MRPNERRNKIIERLSFRREDTMGNHAEQKRIDDGQK